MLPRAADLDLSTSDDDRTLQIIARRFWPDQNELARRIKPKSEAK